MKKALLAGLSVLIIFLGMPILATLMVLMSTTATAECRTQTHQSVGAAEHGYLGNIDGPIGLPVEGTIGLASANIPNRSGLAGFRSSMPKVLSTNPDFVTLNEVGDRSLAEIEGAAPGYSAYRELPATGPGASQSMGNVVLWKNDVWSKRNAGRVKLVEDDNAYYNGRPVVWDRFATWALLQRKSDGAVVSVISVHHMTNPRKFPRQHGNPPLTRPQQYGAGMDVLLQLRNSLATHGPVLIGGDLNTQASYTELPWSAAAKMKAAGYGWQNHGVDFIFFPQNLGVRLERGWSGAMVSDHDWVAARLAMNGVGPEDAPSSDTGDGSAPAVHTAADGPPNGGVLPQLMRLRFASTYPTMTTEQASNAITIAQVARDLEIPRYGLQIAIATAIQESKLVNLTGGDRDSGGLFQQRPSQGWGSRAEVTNPVVAARAFFGKAQHTANPGLLDLPGWSTMRLTQAAQAVQNSAYPDAYAQWEDVADDIADLLGPDLQVLPGSGSEGSTTEVADCQEGNTAGCVVANSTDYELGPVEPQLAQLVNLLGPMFDIKTVGGYRESATDPNGHPAGLAADFMISSKAQGDRLAAYAQAHAAELGIDYIIWYQRIWSVARAAEGWRPMEDRGSATENHRDHVHINVKPGASAQAVGIDGMGCDEVVYPVPPPHVGTDNHNWHETGRYWSTWHSGTDFSAPCGTTVYAAHAGNIEIDTTQSWAGPQLVRVTTGAGSLTTWYAHMQTVIVSRGQTVAVGEPIGQIGKEGNVSGCHLHFEVHLENGSIYGADNVDPSTWLAENVSRPTPAA